MSQILQSAQVCPRHWTVSLVCLGGFEFGKNTNNPASVTPEPMPTGFRAGGRLRFSVPLQQRRSELHQKNMFMQSEDVKGVKAATNRHL